MQLVFGNMQKLLYLCEVKIQKAFIDACFGVLNPARFLNHPKQDGDRCPRDMYPQHPCGVCTYRRGLMLFILVAGSCRNLRIENKQVSCPRFFVLAPMPRAARKMEENRAKLFDKKYPTHLLRSTREIKEIKRKRPQKHT